MTTWTERSFDLISEITKQVLALSTGVVALSVTFLTDVAQDAGETARILLGSSWVAFALAIVFGMLTLMAAAGLQRDAGQNGAATPTINAGNLRFLGGVQLLFFAVGMVLLLVAGILAF